MKSTVSCVLTAILAVGAVAHSHNHHHHAKRDASIRLEKREPGTKTIYTPGSGPTSTVYLMDGKPIPASEAEMLMSSSGYVAQELPSTTTSQPKQHSTSTTASVTPTVAQTLNRPVRAAPQLDFVAEKSEVAEQPEVTNQSEVAKESEESDKNNLVAPVGSNNAPVEHKPAEETSSSLPQLPSEQPLVTAPKADSGGDLNTQLAVVDKPFPNGMLSCDQFPSDYGAVPASWLGAGATWSGTQQISNDPRPGTQTNGIDRLSIIEAGPGPRKCTKGDMCSYHCPIGYEKAQYPEPAYLHSGSTIGGLWCNNEDGKLYLTSNSALTLCRKGAGGVTARNELREEVSICRTDYPGTEAMVLATVVPSGDEVDVTNPFHHLFKIKGDQKTSAQYYLNIRGVPTDQACVWKPTNPNFTDIAGDNAPMILGTSRDEKDMTFSSVFTHKHDGVDVPSRLNFNVDIIVGTLAKCTYLHATHEFRGEGARKDGCTAAAQAGQTVVYRFY